MHGEVMHDACRNHKEPCATKRYGNFLSSVHSEGSLAHEAVMSKLRMLAGKMVSLVLGPVEPLAANTYNLADLYKDLATSLAWSFQALLAASAFCAITAASHGDWDLLKGGETELPLISLKLAFLPFLLIGPLVLLAMQVYLQIQTHELLLIPLSAANSLIRNHGRWWPISLLGFASYAVVPLVTLFFLWKIWPRAFSDDPILFDDVRFHIGRAAIGAVLAISCAASLRAALADRRYILLYIRQLDGNGTQRRIGRRATAGLVLTSIGLSVWIGITFSDRHFELRKAPLDGSDLRYFDLRHADLREARLQGALMGGAMLPDATLAGANLEWADLRGVELSGADLSAARLNHADLRGAWLVGANLRNVEAEGARLDYAWLVGATFEPLPATPADRTKPPSEADATDDQIKTMSLAGAETCAAMITPGHWKDRAVEVGDIDAKGGQAFYDDAHAGEVPDQLHAAPLSKAMASSHESRDRVLADAFAQCFIKLDICKKDPFPDRCDWTSGE